MMTEGEKKLESYINICEMSIAEIKEKYSGNICHMCWQWTLNTDVNTKL